MSIRSAWATVTSSVSGTTPSSRLRTSWRSPSRPTALDRLATRQANHVIFASAIIETIEDSTYGTINALVTRLNQGHFGGGQGQGYVFMSGAPVSGTVQRVPLRVQTENFNAGAALNAVNASSFRLGAATTSIVLQSEQISWAELQIVGIEFGTPIKTVATDSVFFEDLQVGVEPVSSRRRVPSQRLTSWVTSPVVAVEHTACVVFARTRSSRQPTVPA